MIAEIDILGVFVPALLAWVVLALMLAALVRRGLRGAGLYRHVWHAPLFDAALFLILLGGIVALVHGIGS